MVKTKVGVSGMACSMCEAHINDAGRNNFNVKKVSSSRRKGLTEIKSESPLDADKLREVISSAGYTVTDISVE